MAELSFIEYIRKNFSRRKDEIGVGIGDDAMIFKNGYAVSTDSFVEGIHFDCSYFTKYAIGYRCMSASLSDLAAVSAKPLCCLISLYLPEKTKKSDIVQLYHGFGSVCMKYHCDISGGDIVESPFLGITITVIGKTKKPLLRSGARSGDFLYITNYPGLAETGRIALSRGYNKKLFPESIKHHLYPEPRIMESQKLRGYLHAGIDTSDGLSTDAIHLAEESKVKIVIEHIPIHPEVALLCRMQNKSPIEFVLSAGEDFELLLTGRLAKTTRGTKVLKIGRITEGKGVYIVSGKGIRRISASGYEHLK